MELLYVFYITNAQNKGRSKIQRQEWAYLKAPGHAKRISTGVLEEGMDVVAIFAGPKKNSSQLGSVFLVISGYIYI